MTSTEPNGWLSRVERPRGPLYAAILQALETAIRTGELQPGDRLPPQRRVAEILGVDITTVTRAYSVATEKGLIKGAVGRGTFVGARAVDDDPGRIDLSMNLPPPPAGLSLAAMLRETTSDILQRSDTARLMSYHPGVGSWGQRTAATAWLAPVLGDVEPERVMVTSGAQTVLAAVLNAIGPPGTKIVVEPLTYPGLKQVAARLGVELLACPADEEGLLPDELERICCEQGAAAVYIVPTMQNPTAITTTEGRRADIAKVAQAQDLWIIEDDPYSRLLPTPLPALASLAPHKTFYVATLSKCLSPGLRIAYLVCPPGEVAATVANNLRALSLMPSPLMAAVVTSWIREGSAEQLLSAVRQEACARRKIARQVLPQATAASENSIHVWLDLPPAWPAESLREAAQARSLSIVPTEAFAVGHEHRNGVRISLGGPETTQVLGAALQSLAELIGQTPGPRGVVV